MRRIRAAEHWDEGTALLNCLEVAGLRKLDPEPISPTEALQIAMGQGGIWPNESHEELQKLDAFGGSPLGSGTLWDTPWDRMRRRIYLAGRFGTLLVVSCGGSTSAQSQCPSMGGAGVE
jgi:hypothetical protein